MKNRTITFSAIGFLAFAPQMRALPPEIPGNPDGCYPAFTTAEGCNALFLLGAGEGNTAVGWYSLFLAGDASFNTGVGAGALALTTTGADSNTAVGTAALLLNTAGDDNTAVGTNALVFNDSGSDNNAVGAFALYNNIDGFDNNAFGNAALFYNIHAALNTAIGEAALLNNDVTENNIAYYNTAVGARALFSNADGDSNTAVGFNALYSNDTGFDNNAVGAGALQNNTTGGQNQVMGVSALANNDTGSANIAIGHHALSANVNGLYNTVVGWEAGNSVEGTDNIYIGESAGAGIAAEDFTTRIGAFQDHCYIDGIYGSTYGPNDLPVRIGNDGKLGTMASSARFKKDIKSMDKASESILALKPVTFHYKSDAEGKIPQFGLVAEEVAKVNPDLVVLDRDGKPYSVRYEQVNAMLLNEFLKEHRKVEKLEAAFEAVNKRLKEQDAQIQKVNAQIEVTKPVRQLVSTD